MTSTSYETQMSSARIAVVIPSYKVTRHIAPLIAAIPSYIWRIYVVDDACPDQSGNFVKANCTDPRITIVFHEVNQGVGGAVMTGYRAAIEDGAQVIVKIDGDGQMDPALIPNFVDPILSGEADYTKGNRFFDLEKVRAMPKIRLFGNAVLSLMTKLSSGYWDLFDPTNGYTAIHARVAEHLPMEKLSRRYFFETDVLFRLNTLRAVVMDVPMEAQYGDEVSNLKISKIVTEFLFKHARNFLKRIGYNYYLRDMSLGSLELPIGLLLFCGGGVFGIYQWINSMRVGVETSSGTVMLAALPILMGIQLILSFFGQDIAAVPRTPLHKKISKRVV
ncbi:glycosyltransferase family 2 protein [uncultured Variovorax sp.]|uniref:glycosyltransferase family 2 protein n=1 Tax=uncultured Variovorax sp. TaxID=114708 RepID=UPI0025ECABD1|nr:glycosyltransferase family 2 protein [uncultured Variovorax sp.]